MGRKAKEMSGKKFNRLFVIARVVSSANHARWFCICECGKSAIADGNHIRNGMVKSCGCARVENGYRVCFKHGLEGTPEYYSWSGMIQRCYNPKAKRYDRYGGRGITVCKSWLNSFGAFFEDMGNKPSGKHSIDRIENNGNYEPGNCRWATAKEQANNRTKR